MRVKIEQIHDRLAALPPSSSVSITRPEELAKEGFPQKGSGQLGRGGGGVLHAERWDQLGLPRLRERSESAFGRRLAGDYFERTPLLRAYVSEHYRTAVILTDVDGVPYLDKFAVLDDAQGEGLGRAVWQVMREETPRLFWRSRHHNAVTSSTTPKPTAVSGRRGGGRSGTGSTDSSRSNARWRTAPCANPRCGIERWLHANGSRRTRSEEHTSELQSLMRNSYAVFILKKKKN